MVVEPVDAVTTRCRELGLDDASPPNPNATIRASSGRVPATAPTLVPLLYGSDFAPAVPSVAVLVAAGAITATSGITMTYLGDPAIHWRQRAIEGDARAKLPFGNNSREFHKLPA